METLGSGENRAYIYDRPGTTRLLDLVTTNVTWPRELCDVSRATVRVGPETCTKKHSKLATWAHTLVIYRDGDRVWEGPLRKIVHGPDGLSLSASDVLGWTERRVASARAMTGSPVVAEALATIQDAFARDDPNVLQYLRQIGGNGAGVDRDIKAAGQYASAALSDLVKSGARYTTLGRAILVWSDAITLQRTATLVPEQHLLTDVNVIQSGDVLATSVTARDDATGVATYAGPGPAGTSSEFHGLVELLLSSPSPQATAESTWNLSYPEPVFIEVPGGATLSCDSPFPISHLVPGALVPVQTTTATGKTVAATLQLTNVTVQQTAGKDETVAVTLSPISQAG